MAFQKLWRLDMDVLGVCVCITEKFMQNCRTRFHDFLCFIWLSGIQGCVLLLGARTAMEAVVLRNP